MRHPTAIVAIALLAVAGVGYTQMPPPLPGPASPVEVTPLLPFSTLEQSVAPPEQSVEQMLDTVDALRLQKAVLEKQEKAIIEQLSKKVEKQSERMRKLGIGTTVPVERPSYTIPLIAPAPSLIRPNLPD